MYSWHFLFGPLSTVLQVSEKEKKHKPRRNKPTPAVLRDKLRLSSVWSYEWCAATYAERDRRDHKRSTVRPTFSRLERGWWLPSLSEGKSTQRPRLFHIGCSGLESQQGLDVTGNGWLPPQIQRFDAQAYICTKSAKLTVLCPRREPTCETTQQCSFKQTLEVAVTRLNISVVWWVWISGLIFWRNTINICETTAARWTGLVDNSYQTDIDPDY